MEFDDDLLAAVSLIEATLPKNTPAHAASCAADDDDVLELDDDLLAAVTACEASHTNALPAPRPAPQPSRAPGGLQLTAEERVRIDQSRALGLKRRQEFRDRQGLGSTREQRTVGSSGQENQLHSCPTEFGKLDNECRQRQLQEEKALLERERVQIEEQKIKLQQREKQVHEREEREKTERLQTAIKEREEERKQQRKRHRLQHPHQDVVRVF